MCGPGPNRLPKSISIFLRRFRELEEGSKIDVGLGEQFTVEKRGLCFLEVAFEVLELREGVCSVVDVGVWCLELTEEGL